jgi:hypothetical protein
VQHAGRPHDRLAVVHPGALVAHLDEATPADDDEQRRVRVRVRRDHRVALEGELRDKGADIVVDDLPGNADRPDRAVSAAVSRPESTDLHAAACA